MRRRPMARWTSAALVAATLACVASPAAGASAIPGSGNATPPDRGALEPVDRTALRVTEAVLHLFEQDPDLSWPGYSLARQPFVLYVPDRWLMLFNAAPGREGFGAPPDGWPDLDGAYSFRDGGYPGLVGQLAFDVPIGDTLVVAVGLPKELPAGVENLELEIFSYVVHEAFHQYQHAAFERTTWCREEIYPISDEENSALAWLEMRILEEALGAVVAGDDELCRRRAEQFAGVRSLRWRKADSFVPGFERGKELTEGTAKYVELVCLARLGRLDYVSNVPSWKAPLHESVPDASVPSLIIKELRERRGERCLEPQDVPRNRIYAVGSAQCFLLDHLGVEWRSSAEAGGDEFTYAELIREALGSEHERLGAAARQAMDEYGYEEALAAAARARKTYERGYAAAREAFESQKGVRVEIVTPNTNVSRSRSTRERKWLVSDGEVCLCSGFEVYTLRGTQWEFDLHHAGLLELNDWENGRREIVFFAPGPLRLSLDGEPVAPGPVGAREYGSLSLRGESFSLKADLPGVIESGEEGVRVRLVPERSSDE